MADPPKLIQNRRDGIHVGPSSVAEFAKPRTLEMSPEAFRKVLEMYNPEEDPAVKVKTLSAQQLYEAARVPRLGEDKKPTTVSARLVLPAANRKGYREARARGWDQLDSVTKSSDWAVAKIREAHGLSRRETRALLRESKHLAESDRSRLNEQFGVDLFSLGAPDGTATGNPPNDEFRPIMLGPFNRQLYLYDMLDMQSKAFEAWNHNPIAKAIVNLMLYFTLGDGSRVHWRAGQLGDTWGKWAEATKWDEKTRLWFRDASILGEAFLHDPGSKLGSPSFDLIDASTVWEIVTNPRQIEDVLYLHRQFPTQWQVPYSAVEKPVLDPGQMVPVSEYVIEQFPPDEWLQIKLNATIGEKRGRSDLFAVLGWLKRFKDWFNAAVVRGQISNAFVVWWEINGSDADVQTLKNNADFQTMPPPGSAWFTNQAVVPHLLTAEGGLSASDKTGEQLLAIIATSLNLPPEYLGVAGSSPRATALTRAEPAAKTFENRQKVVREAISWQARRFAATMLVTGAVESTVVSKATRDRVMSLLRGGKDQEAKQMIDAMLADQAIREPIDETYDVIMPPMQPDDRSARMKDLATARMTGVVSQETYATQVAEVLDLKHYDFDHEQSIMDDEKARGITVPVMPRTGAGGLSTPGNGGAEKPKIGSAEDNNRYRANTQERPPS